MRASEVRSTGGRGVGLVSRRRRAGPGRGERRCLVLAGCPPRRRMSERVLAATWSAMGARVRAPAHHDTASCLYLSLSSSLSRRVVCTRRGMGMASPLSISLCPRIVPIHSLPYIKDSSSRGHGDVSAVTRAVCSVLGGGRPRRMAPRHATPRHHHKLINK